MTEKLEALLTFLRNADTPETLEAATARVRDRYHVRHCVYHRIAAGGDRFCVGTHPAAWRTRYDEMDYFKSDPVIFGCLQRVTPANWKDLDWSTKAARAMFEDGRAHGLGNQGYSIPLHGPQGQFALLTLNHDAGDADWEGFVAANGRDLMVLAHEFNRRALEVRSPAEGAVSPALSPRELAAIRCLARGLSRAQAAAELGISEHTLRVYIESGRHKLGAHNTTHAVARALSAGLIIV